MKKISIAVCVHGLMCSTSLFATTTTTVTPAADVDASEKLHSVTKGSVIVDNVNNTAYNEMLGLGFKNSMAQLFGMQTGDPVAPNAGTQYTTTAAITAGGAGSATVLNPNYGLSSVSCSCDSYDYMTISLSSPNPTASALYGAGVFQYTAIVSAGGSFVGIQEFGSSNNATFYQGSGTWDVTVGANPQNSSSTSLSTTLASCSGVVCP